MSETGRFYIHSIKTGKVYCVEPTLGRVRNDTEWGSIDPATGDLTHKKGWLKYTGAIRESDSVITTENGFVNITTIEAGKNPMEYIERLETL